MKTSLKMVLIVLIVSYSCWSQGQGTFQFQNRNTAAGIDAPVFDAQGVRLSGNDYLADLYGGSNSNSLSATTPQTVAPFFTGIVAGYFQNLQTALVPNVPGNTFVWLQVRAWDARLGATYEAVVALGQGGYGASPLFFALGGDPNGVPPTGPRPLIGLQSFSLLPVVPEPATWVLLALGGTALWVFRRAPRGRL